MSDTPSQEAPPPQLPSLHQLPAWFGWVVVLYATTLLLVGAAGTGPLTHHEVLYSQPAREMLATGDWAVPHNMGLPWTEKPPAVHWVNALAMALTGSSGELAVRLPSVLSGAGLALLMAVLAARWFGPRAGLLAGLIQGTTLYTLRLARLAEVEMLLTLAIAGAMACFLLACVDSPRGRSRARWLPWVFYLCVAASFLLKGLVGPIFVFGACGAYILWQREWSGLRFLLSPIGIGLALAAVLAWAIPAYLRYPPYLDMLVLHHFGRLKGELGGGKDPFYYLYSTLLVVLPWTPAVLWGAVQVVRRGGLREPLWRFAICWIVPGLLLLHASTYKASHYLSPLMPPLSLLGALGLMHFVSLFRRRSWTYFALRAVPAVAGCAAGAAAVILLQTDDSVMIAILLAVLGLGLLATIIFESRGQRRAYLLAVFALVWLVAAGAFWGVLPHHNSYSDQTALARRINARVPAGAPLYTVGLWEDQIVYYLQPTLIRSSVRQLAAADRDADSLYVLAPEKRAEELALAGEVRQVDQCPTMKWYLAERGGRLTLFRIDRRTSQALRPTTNR